MKRALVTGAGQGIGRAIALAFLAEGAEVIAADFNPRTLGELPGHDALTIVAADLARAADVERLAGEAGSLDVLVNCVGWVHTGDILACELADWERSFDLNVTSMYRLVRAVLPAMLDRPSAIVNIGSVVSSLKGVPNRVAYGASKGAVIGLTKAIAADYVGRQLRCNAICPGTVESPSLAERMAATGDADAARAAFIARQPMGRIGTAGEIAAAAVYLASDESAFVTGATFVIDGGMSL